MSNTFFKSLPPLILAKHYALLALLLFINIASWLVLIIAFPSSSSFFLSLLGIMIGVMALELIPIYFIYSVLTKELSVNVLPHIMEFFFTSVSFLSVTIPLMWTSWLLRAHQVTTLFLSCFPSTLYRLLPYIH
jgi:hypothetical protein